MSYDDNEMNTGEEKKGSGLFWILVLLPMILVIGAVGYFTDFGAEFFKREGQQQAANATWQPSKPVEFVIMAGKGGGADRMARFIQNIIETNNLSSQPFIVVNKGGGSGGEALRYLQENRGNPHVVLMTLNSLFTTPLRDPSLKVDIEEFTPVARLAQDTFLLWVNAGTNIRTMNDYVAAVRAAGPENWVMGGTGSGQEDSLVTALLERAFGIQHSYQAFKGGGTVARNLISGQVNSTVNNPSEQMSFYRAGKSRPIAAFTPDRLPAFPDVPTFRELGYDLVYYMQRSVIAPAGSPPEAQAFYQNLFHKVYLSDEWENYAQEKSLGPAFLPGRPLRLYFRDEREKHRELLSSMGEIG